MSYLCPVCGYNKLTRPPKDYHICPCCGTEFEADDFETTYAQLRRQWLNNGALWFSRRTPKPYGWNPFTQLTNLASVTHRAKSFSQGSKIKVLNNENNRFVHNPSESVFTSGYWQIIENVGETKAVRA